MDQPSPIPEFPSEAPALPAMSLFARLTNIFAAPSEVFEEVKARPLSTVNWIVPAVIFVLVCWVGASVIFSQDSIKQQLSDFTGKTVEKQIQKAKMSEQQATVARQTAEKYGSMGMKVSAVVGPVLVAFLSPFWWGLIIWLGAKVFKGGCEFMKAVEVAGLANMINVLYAVVDIPLKISMGNFFASPSLALVLKDFDPQNPVHALLAVVNFMTLWALAVRSIGLARLSGISFGKAAVWVFGIWAAYTSVIIGFSFGLQAVMAK